ncbi:MAG: hypothetical protein J6V66_07345 [Clostridia bacterium]|nr:hypothetical protein [Clostridia bacterium]
MRKLLLTVLATILGLTLMMGLTGCKGLELDAPTNIRYDGTTITWNSVENADQYKISINGGDSFTINTNSYYFKANGADFTVTITATNKSEKVASEGVATQNFTSIGKISEVRIDQEGKLTWNVIDGATAYRVRIDGTEVPTEVIGTEYDGIQPGTHSVQVRPVVSGNNSVYSEWSDAKTITILAQVNKDTVSYSNVTSTISWGAVYGATKYEVKVNGIVVASENEGTQCLYNSNSQNFTVEVKALGDGVTTFNGKVSDVKSFMYLPTVTEIEVVEGKLKWGAVSGADGYKLKIGGIERSEIYTTCEFNNLTANVSTDIQIMPISNNATYFSDWSAVKTVLILPTPVLQWNDSLEHEGEAMKSIYWDLVKNAAGYTVRVTSPNGQSVDSQLDGDQDGYANAYLEPGIYTVQVKATTTDANTYESKFSDAITIVRLAAPVQASSNFIVSTADDVSKGFTVNFERVNGARGYKLYRDSVASTTSQTTQFVVTDVVDNSVIEEQSYNFSIQALGGVTRHQGLITATLSSLTSKSLNFGVKVLAQPSTPTIDGYMYEYGQINGANGYAVNVDGAKFSSGNTSYDLSVLEAGSFNVRVCAKGNGKEILASNYTGAINVVRLEAPRNVKINTSEASEGVLGWDSVLHAQSYVVVFDGTGQTIPAEDIQNMNQYITTEGTTIHMESIANYFNTDKTIYYMSSKAGLTTKFVKLAAPTFGDVAFNNNQLIWNAPANVNANKYTPTYEVYYPNGTTYNGEKNGTTMDISSLAGGKTYTFSVKAIGNGVEFINSEKSSQVSVYKLETPEVRRENGKYVWNGVISATSYVIYIDGVVAETYTHVTGETYSHTPKFDDLKDYSIEVIAIGDGGYTTIDSDACKFVQKTKQLTTPDFKLTYSEDAYSETGVIIATITKESDYASGYSYTISGVEQTSKELSCSHNPSVVGRHEARVYALGGAFDEEGTYYLDSQSVGGKNTQYYIILLAVPNESSIVLSAEGMLRWATIDNAVEYEVVIEFNGVALEEPITAIQPQINLNNYIDNYNAQKKNLVVTIRAKGNGNKIISSTTVTKEFNNLNA